MKKRTKVILKHSCVTLLCAAAAAALAVFANSYKEAHGADTGWTQYIPAMAAVVELVFAAGVFIHINLLFANARICCRKCGETAILDSYRVTDKTMYGDGVHIRNEKILFDMKCLSCGERFAFNKKFIVQTYRRKYNVWMSKNVDKMVGDYARGNLWF